jgi:hypothetical protein
MSDGWGFEKVGGPKDEIEGENRRGEGMPLCLVSLHSMDLNLKYILKSLFFYGVTIEN